MLIDGKKAPEKEGYETQIYLCCKCEVADTCEVEECKNNGWCHTFHKPNEV